MGEKTQTIVPEGEVPDPHTKLLNERIAVCSTGELFGGVERHILGLLDGLREYHTEPLLILFHDCELAAQARDKGCSPIILPSRNRSLWTTSRTLALTLKQRQIRIAHVHGYKATVFCAMARRWHPFGIVKTEHGLPEPMKAKPFHMVRDRFYHLVDNRATRIAGATVCYVTEDLREQHARNHSELRTTVIPNGVSNMDKVQFERPVEFHQEWFNLAIVGRLDTVKGHHVAIEALANEVVPHVAHLHIIGTGPTEPKLRKLAKTHGVAERVHFLGFRRNVYDYLAHCDVLLMPSLHEGLPYTLLEAMALGKPIIASRVGGPMEIAKHGVTSLLVPVADMPALGRGIRQLYDDQNLCEQLGRDAQRLQRTEYSLDAMATRYLEVYRNTLADHSYPDF